MPLSPEALEARMDAALKRITNLTDSGGKDAEKQYAQAYDGLVQLGLRPKLRAKYRKEQ